MLGNSSTGIPFWAHWRTATGDTISNVATSFGVRNSFLVMFPSDPTIYFPIDPMFWWLTLMSSAI